MVPGDFGPPIWITARSCGSRCRLQFARLRGRQLRQQRVQHLHVVGGLERGGGDDRRAADLCQREFEFAQAIGGIDGDEDESRLGGGELRQRPFRPVQRPHPDPRAAFEPEREKARRQRVDAFGKLLPCPAHVMARRNQRLAIAPARGGPIEAAPDGIAKQRRVGDAADVAVDGVGQVGFSRCQMLHALRLREGCKWTLVTCERKTRRRLRRHRRPSKEGAPRMLPRQCCAK